MVAQTVIVQLLYTCRGIPQAVVPATDTTIKAAPLIGTQELLQALSPGLTLELELLQNTCG